MFAYTVAFIDRQILSLLVQPIKEDLGVSDTQIGLLAGLAFAIFYSFIGIPIAKLADTKNRVTIISVGVALWTLMTALCGLTKTYFYLFLARVGVGVGEAALSPAAYSMIADYFPKEKLGRAIGVYVIGLYLGAGLAMLVGSAVISMVSSMPLIELPYYGIIKPWQLTFLLVSIPGILVLILLLTISEPERVSHTDLEMQDQTTFKEVVIYLWGLRKIFINLNIGICINGAVIAGFMVWIPEWLRRTFEINIVDAGLIYGLALLVFGSIGPFMGGWASDYLAKKNYKDAPMRTVLYAAILTIPFAAIMPLAPNLLFGVILLCIVTFLFSVPQGLPPVVMQLIAPNHMRAQTTAIFMLFSNLFSYAFGAAIIAVITDYIGYENALKYSMSIVSICLIPIGSYFVYLTLQPMQDFNK
jgi:MFS family permease